MLFQLRLAISQAILLIGAVGCSGNEFDGKTVSKKPPQGEDSSPSNEIESPGIYRHEAPAQPIRINPTPVDISITALPAPEIKIMRVERFKGKFYPRFECSLTTENPETCEFQQREFSFQVPDLSMAIIGEKDEFTGEEYLTAEKLSQLPFSSQKARPKGEGNFEIGPLESQVPGDSVAAIVVRLQASKETQSLTSYRVFLVEKDVK